MLLWKMLQRLVSARTAWESAVGASVPAFENAQSMARRVEPSGSSTERSRTLSRGLSMGAASVWASPSIIPTVSNRDVVGVDATLPADRASRRR